MRAEIIGVGTEILLGQIVNDNARWMSERLAEIGVDVLHHQVVGDNVDRIAEAFELAMSRSEVVLSTGGLGPTQDDITRDGLAQALGISMERHPEIEDFLRAKFERINRPMHPSNLIQAMVPVGCRYILPDRGTAPGLVWDASDGSRVYCVPGVPAEMREMMDGIILPELRELTGEAIVSRVIRSTGIAEAKVGELLGDLFDTLENPTVAYLASSGEVKVRLTAKAATEAEAEALIAPVCDEVVARIGDFVFTTRNEELEEAVGRLLRGAGKSLATAESITAGTVAGRITSVPGSSDYFLGGAIAYTPEEKTRVLRVSRETLDDQGVVSRECAREMAQGGRELFGADICVALTGAAGPDPHGGALVGEMWVAIETDEGISHQRGFRAPGDREQVRRWGQQAALDLIRRSLEGLKLPD